MRRAIIALGLLVACPALAQSDQPPARMADTQLADPAKEREAKALMETLRCLVCQGQSIADSEAEMAGDMRALVRERMQQGESAGQVRDWLIERYGDYVSYDPPVTEATAPLWIAPILLLIAGVAVAARSFKRKARKR
ncbi:MULTISPECIES: cytochrome c-type biogenesis protein [unclassified Sphingomonas]|uniref:cytochrome c-type biogenesis protein n=1 Tax=unclassified Sphingomonas TaxID=196159 RepID=UPI000831EB20|nr:MULTISPECIES: cytochrome c-type biogenesis protein [unclassified Sphingomonas]